MNSITHFLDLTECILLHVALVLRLSFLLAAIAFNPFAHNAFASKVLRYRQPLRTIECPECERSAQMALLAKRMHRIRDEKLHMDFIDVNAERNVNFAFLLFFLLLSFFFFWFFSGRIFLCCRCVYGLLFLLCLVYYCVTNAAVGVYYFFFVRDFPVCLS